jgi:hypothetical protein
VDDQENKNERPEYAHVARSPMGRISVQGIALWSTRASVSPRENNRPDDMDQYERIIDVGDNFDERVGGHELGIYIKRLTVVVVEQLKVANKMHHQKENEKKTGQGHHYFSPNRTGEKILKPIHSLFN